MKNIYLCTGTVGTNIFFCELYTLGGNVRLELFSLNPISLEFEDHLLLVHCLIVEIGRFICDTKYLY